MSTPFANGPTPHRAAPTGRLAMALLAAALCATGALAQPGPGGHLGPPAEALAACKRLKAGAACRFTGPHGAASGKCLAPEGRPLACRPDGAPPPPAGAASGAARQPRK